MSCEVVPAQRHVRAPTPAELARYAWLAPDTPIRALDESFAPPEGFTRAAVEPGSFGAWLRGLPLRAPDARVRRYDGRTVHEADEPGLAAVVEIDIGPRDLQQCADSVIRLHAEWQWSAGRTGDIAYRFTSGHVAPWSGWAAGDRPLVQGSRVTWTPEAPGDASRAAFREYLDVVFTYAGTLSLERDAAKVAREDVQPGDLFVIGGSPGHAVLVLDLARDARGHAVALLGEGFLPAQDVHVLASDDPGSPWYSLDGPSIVTPFWRRPFPWASLRRLAPTAAAPATGSR
jgi:hypothetical protein